jgi:hypothetical protein
MSLFRRKKKQKVKIDVFINDEGEMTRCVYPVGYDVDVKIHDSNEEVDLIPNWSDTKEKRVVKFMIPVGGKTREEAEKEIAQMIEDYKEEIEFDEESGEIKLDGEKLPFKKDFFI